MTATAFSLLDVSGHLLYELYDLNLSGKKVNFYNVANVMESRDEDMYHFLEKYLIHEDKSRSVSWISPLKRIRNATTHERITHICKFHEDSYTYPRLASLAIRELRVAGDILGDSSSMTIQDFARISYEGLEDFVMELYNLLHAKLEADKQIPLY